MKKLLMLCSMISSFSFGFDSIRSATFRQLPYNNSYANVSARNMHAMQTMQRMRAYRNQLPVSIPARCYCSCHHKKTALPTPIRNQLEAVKVQEQKPVQQSQQPKQAPQQQIEKVVLQERTIADEQNAYHQKRKAAENTIQHNDAKTVHHYELNNQTQDLIKEYELDVQHFVVLDGNALQHALHQECITIAHHTTPLHYDYRHNNAIQQLNTLTITSLDVALEYNRRGNTSEASKVTDLCWAALSCAQNVAFGLCAGIIQGCKKTIEAVWHPITTISNIAKSAGILAACLVYVLAINDEMEMLFAMDPVQAEKRIRENLKPIEAVILAIQDRCKALSLRDWSREATSFAVEAYLQGKLLHGIGKFFEAAHTNIPQILETITTPLRDNQALLATAEGVPIYVAEEVVSLAKAEQLKNFNKVTEVGEKITSKISNLIGSFRVTNYHPSIGNLNKLEKAIELFEHTPGALLEDGPLFKALEFGKKACSSGRLSTARGAMYELEKAVELAEKGEIIVALGEKRIFGTASREFDIITKTKLIECKNIDWTKRVGRVAKNTKNNFGDQAKIANGLGMDFEIHSKNSIPDNWKSWFIKKGIRFLEG